MEDDHILIDMPSASDHLFLAVFDGHGGSGAAHYAAREMISHIERTNEWQEYVSGGKNDVHVLGKALKQAFKDCDASLRVHQKPTSDVSGCTANTAMITPNHIICANAGDSRCILARDQSVIEMSKDHKPSDKEENDRITKAGGLVQFKRVDGDLAVSRALGDFQYKTSDELPPEQQKVSCEPDIKIVDRDNSKDEALILACDGLWDVFSNGEAADELRAIFASGESSALKIAEEMIDLALEKNSKDNISAVVVKLPGAVIAQSGGGVDARKNEREQRKQELYRDRQGANDLGSGSG